MSSYFIVSVLCHLYYRERGASGASLALVTSWRRCMHYTYYASWRGVYSDARLCVPCDNN
jgi:hypothetical protein